MQQTTMVIDRDEQESERDLEQQTETTMMEICLKDSAAVVKQQDHDDTDIDATSSSSSSCDDLSITEGGGVVAAKLTKRNTEKTCRDSGGHRSWTKIVFCLVLLCLFGIGLGAGLMVGGRSHETPSTNSTSSTSTEAVDSDKDQTAVFLSQDDDPENGDLHGNEIAVVGEKVEAGPTTSDNDHTNKPVPKPAGIDTTINTDSTIENISSTSTSTSTSSSATPDKTEGQTSWPELVGMKGIDAKRQLEELYPNNIFDVIIVVEGTPMTRDYRPTRIRLIVDVDGPDGVVIQTPRIG